MAQKAKSKSDGGGKLFYILAGVIVLAGGAWLFLARGGGPSAALPTPAEFEALAVQVEPDPSVGIALGPASAPIELVEFADYSCPHCATFAGFAGKLLRQNYVETGPGAPVRWVLYDYVLGTFPNSVPAHMAARCAGDQGLYWPMHDLIFARQTRWYTSDDPQSVLEGLAEMAGADVRAYRACMSEARYLEQIAASRKYGEQRGVSSTPTLFLDGQKLDLGGVEPYSFIERLIKAKLEAAASTGGAAAGGDSAPGAAPGP